MSFVSAESVVDPVALRDARIRMGLTQHELARLIGLYAAEDGHGFAGQARR